MAKKDGQPGFGLGIFSRLFIAFLAAALIPLLITWYFARDRAVADASALAELRLQTQADLLAEKVGGWLSLNHHAMRASAASPAMQTMRPDAQLPLIQSARAVKTWTDSMMTVGTDGTSVTRDDGRPPTSYADRAWFRAITTGKPIAQQVVLARGGNSGANAPGWVVAVPINGPAGGVVGALVELNTLTQITELLVKQTIGRTGKAMLFAPDGKLIAMTGVAMDKELKDMSSHAAFKAAQSGTDAAHYDNDGRPVLARLKKTQLDWVVAVQMDEEEVMARVRETDAYMLRLLAVAAVLAALFALIVAPGIARPIRSLTKITEEISRGNFEHEISEAKRGDEIGALARSVERMTKSLRIAMTRLADRR